MGLRDMGSLPDVSLPVKVMETRTLVVDAAKKSSGWLSTVLWVAVLGGGGYYLGRRARRT